MEYLVIPGGSCFTAAEAQKLRDVVNHSFKPATTGPSRITGLWGSWAYYISIHEPKGGISGDTMDKLLQLLPPSQPPGAQQQQSQHLERIGYCQKFYVVPRNISPWSSKATSIAHVCGLKDRVVRIERGRVLTLSYEEPLRHDAEALPHFRDVLYDRMTELISPRDPDLAVMFAQGAPQPLEVVDIFAPGENPLEVLREYNTLRGLALDTAEMDYLVSVFSSLGRPPRDIELFMFAQVNSEHCRHKQFNASWTIDGLTKGRSLFDMIRNTHKATPDHTISAYSDNAAVLEGYTAGFWAPDYSTGVWKLTKETAHMLAKVETHNHPTAISPFPGAATGSGGEIRDEGAVGRGSMPKAGLCGFWISELLIPDRRAPWEIDLGRPAHFASGLDIMLEAPIGSARFNNEFGRPCLAGTFRTLLINVGSPLEDGGRAEDWRGYHKPIMIAGGLGTVRPRHALKNPSDVRPGAHVIVLGGPAMLIGLGGGAASSNASAEESADLDFDSVQRGNPEMQRRAQMVINTCIALGDQNPIAMIHDVGAGGLSNALPELVKDAGYGGNFELRQVESADSSLSPLQIWCNEAQERYVMLVNGDSMNRFVSICRRERCGFSDVGTVTPKGPDGEYMLVVSDRESRTFPRPIDLPMSALFPAGKKLDRIVASRHLDLPGFDPVKSLQDEFGHLDDAGLLRAATERVFNLPSVGSKSFLITIGDRTVGGLTVRDQMVGPWQTPVADVAVTATSFRMGDERRTGEAMAMGDRPALALISPAASARMAVAESLLNLGAANIAGSRDGDLRRVKLSANWMAAVNQPGEGAALYEAVEAIGMELCPQLGVSIPVGKDSTSMKASWTDRKSGEQRVVTSPVSVVISAFAPVLDVRKTWTPQLRTDKAVGETLLIFVDLAQGRKDMGGSALAQSLRKLGNSAPDVRDAELLKDYFDALWQLHESGVVLAYHDRSDGGLMTTLAEMMFAGRCGLDVRLDGMSPSGSLRDVVETLFNEELGAVFQIRKEDETNFHRCFATCGPPPGLIRRFGTVTARSKQTLTIRYGVTPLVVLDRVEMQRWWTNTSYEMQKLRDNQACAEAEFAAIADSEDPGLSYNLTFAPKQDILPILSSITGIFKTPRVAILREQGVNGHAEMAFAFRAAGFEPVDIHMTDIISGRSLTDFVGLAACGGFSYGDVLGGGRGWANSILMHHGHARGEFQRFFARPDTFTLGVCNGCQMLTRLRELIPGTEHWPTFVENTSQQFEARWSMVRIDEGLSSSSSSSTSSWLQPPPPPSVFLHGMSGSSLPIAVSHGEGRALFASAADAQRLVDEGLAPVRYCDNRLAATEAYPLNPNGSPLGVAGVRSRDGRVLALMPHPERTIMADTASYVPPGAADEWGEFGPWLRLFRSARRWVG